MNNEKIMGLIGILIAVLFVSGCTSSANKEFYVGNSTFQLPGDWEQTFSSNGSGLNQGGQTAIKKMGFEVIIKEYPDSSSYDKDTKRSASYHTETNININGTSVSTMETSKAYNSDPTLYPLNLYYFQKNSKYYCLSIAYTETDQKTVNETVTNIIATLK